MTKRAATPDKLPPHSTEAEMGILGCFLLDPICVEDCDLKPDAFYDLRHRKIYEVLKRLWSKYKAFDLITVQAYMKKKGILDEVGGIAYLSECQDIVPSAANLSNYIGIVREKAELRKIITTCSDVVGRIYDYEGNLDELKFVVQSQLGEVFGDAPKSAGKFYSVDDLDAFVSDDDKTNRIGNRWLCRGGKLLIPSASGAGKSSLAMQMLVLFALGKDFCGIKPVHQLSSLLVGDENDMGDLAEQFQGTRDYLQLNTFEHESTYETLRKNLKFWHCPALTGPAFLERIERELESHPRDICCLDPLVSFAGVDLTKQDQASIFLRQGLSRIAEKTGVIWFIIHHTPKPLRDPKNGDKRKLSDFQYAGAGSFDLPGWARAVMTLDEAQDGVYRLVLSKRGKRAGATHPNGEPTQVIWLKHAAKGIHWEQIEPVQQEDRSSNAGRPSKAQQVMESGLGAVIDSLNEPTGRKELARRIVAHAELLGIGISQSTARLSIIPLLVKNKAIKTDANDNYVKQ